LARASTKTTTDRIASAISAGQTDEYKAKHRRSGEPGLSPTPVR